MTDIRWRADAVLTDLLRRYYRGEAGLWPLIRQHVDDYLHQQQVTIGAYHVRFRLTEHHDYLVIVEDATGYEIV